MAQLIDKSDARRYEFHVDDKLAAIEDYELDGNAMTLKHTEAQPEFKGQGIAEEFVIALLKDARQRNLKVIPECSYVVKLMNKHQEFIDLVPQERRAEFKLA
jgi:uncharacterized protein